MIQQTDNPLDYRFIMGLFTGTLVAAGVLLYFAPRTRAELRGRITDSAEALGTQASAAQRNVDTHVSDAFGDISREGQKVHRHVADVIAGGAHEVERLGAVAKTAPRSSS